MDVFKWGPAFFSVNEMFFDRYLECKTSDQMEEAQKEMMALREQLRQENRNREIDLPPSDSDDEDEDEEIMMR
jgi:hypothetical protein